MKNKEILDLREILIDAHAHFFFLKGEGAQRVRLWQILPTSVVIDKPKNAPMRRTVLGYVPTIDGAGVYEIQGNVDTTALPDQMPNTIRVNISPDGIKKVNRRQYPRVSFAPPLEATATAENEKERIPVRIVNLSAGGLRIESNVKMSPKKTFLFQFRIEIDEDIHEMELKGIALYEIPLERGFAYGIKLSPRIASTSKKPSEASIAELDQTVDLLWLVNKLLVKEI